MATPIDAVGFLAGQLQAAEQQNAVQEQRPSQPSEEVQNALEARESNTQQQIGIEAFRQAVESDPVAQIISFLA